MTGPETVLCPIHGVDMYYWRRGDQYACQDITCVHAHGTSADEFRAQQEPTVAAGQLPLGPGRVVPARITLALNAIGAQGPEVDRACGAQEPDVDRWENGELEPTGEQVRLLAAYTGMPVAWFYKPLEPGPLLPGGMFVCFRGPGKDKGGWVPPDVVDERGVLLPGGEPRPPIPSAVQPPLFDEIPPARRAGPAVARRVSSSSRVKPSVRQEPMVPVGRLSDTERHLLMQRLDEAKAARR